MGFRVALTPTATADLEDIRNYLSRHNPAAAERLRTYLLKEVRLICNFTQMGRKVPDLKNQDVRELIRNPYRIIYRVRETEQLIQVIRFWHAARGTPKI